MTLRFEGKLAIQQRVLPAYRAAFFDQLAQACAADLSVYAGLPQPDEQIAVADTLQSAQFFQAQNRHFLKISSPFYQCWQVDILDWLKDCAPDALIVEANPRYPNTPKAIRWMHDRGRPVLGWGLGVPPMRGRLAGLRMRSRLRFLQSLDGVISYSQRGAEEYREAGLPAERVFVALNAAAPRPTRPAPLRPDTLSEQAIVLFVGRLQARKRIDSLLSACASLPETLRPRLWIVGDGPARADFETQAERIYPQTKFFGARFGVDLDAIFSAADLFVLPGTGGLAVQQAMSFGLPVIVAQGDGTQDDLVRPENGWTIPPDDLPALTAALRNALAEPARLRRMGAESYRIVAEEVNLERMVESFIQALDSIRSTQNPSRRLEQISGSG